jgi:putative tryptophan/tyrosine transport system substrate-binding protein
MRWREFITLLGGAAAAWPVAGHAQQGGRIPRIGVLRSSSANDDETQHQIAAFRDALQKLGWTEGFNVRFEYRYADGDAARIRRNGGELAAIGPED